MTGRPRIVAAAVVAMALAALLAVPTPAASQRPELYRPPVEAPVVDPFRPPDQPWLAGNRGLEYDTVPGVPVHTIGSGLVVFAGPVAGQLYVTVLHGDGIRSSYSYLSSVSVAEGDRVRGGQVVGLTGDVRFHLGARLGGAYIDPAGLFGAPVGVASVFLVPLGGGDRPGGGGAPRGRAGEARPGSPIGTRAAGDAGALIAIAGARLGSGITTVSDAVGP